VNAVSGSIAQQDLLWTKSMLSLVGILGAVSSEFAINGLRTFK